MGHLLALRMVAATSAAALLLVVVGPVAEARHRATEWCPSGGRYCINVQRGSDGIRFWIFRDGGNERRYRLCVDGPDDGRTCRVFRMEEGLDYFTDRVVWREHFPDQGAGAYTVVWKRMNGERIGRQLGFHVRG